MSGTKRETERAREYLKANHRPLLMRIMSDGQQEITGDELARVAARYAMARLREELTALCGEMEACGAAPFCHGPSHIRARLREIDNEEADRG